MPLLFGSAKSAPIIGMDEEEEEEDEDEDEYTYEEVEEDEEEDEMEEVEEMEEEDDGRKSNKGTEVELEDECRRMVEVPGTVLEWETKRVQMQRGARFWMPDPERAFRICEMMKEEEEGQTEDQKMEVEVRMEEEDEDEEEGGGRRMEGAEWKKNKVRRDCLQRVSVSHLCEDMCQLSELNEPSVLANIRIRYRHQLIHTYSGLFCVVVNPWCPLPPLYCSQMRHYYASGASSGSGPFPPHVFSIAQNALDGFASSTCGGQDQSILITGESGAGKTENTKRIIEYLTEVAGSRSRGMAEKENETCPEGLERTLVSAGTALEAFANAQTVHNDNSSRLGKFIRINFDRKGQLHSARIDCYLLEKSRVVSQNPGDRNFHIFYRLLANSAFLRSEKANRILARVWNSQKQNSGNAAGPDAGGFHFLNQGRAGDSVHAKFVDDLEGGRETEAALDQLGFSAAEKAWLRELIIACMLVGQIRFGERQGFDVSFVENMTEVEAVVELVGIRATPLVDALTQPAIRVGDALIRRTQPLRKTICSAQSLAKHLYERTVRWVVAKCNGAIRRGSEQEPEAAENAQGHFIGVLDMAGFEIMTRNSFEQLCINYTNERLQQFFNEVMFVREQQEYRLEGIRWEQQDYGTDLQPTIDLIEKPLGILSLLQEECIVPNGSDRALLDKFVRRLSSAAPGVFSKAKHSSRTPSHHHHFTIAHYAGPVSYSVDGWLEKNRNAVDWSILEVLATSVHPLAHQLFGAVNAPTKSASPRGSTRGGSAMAHASISYTYREQLAQLLGTLSTTRAQFIRCIVPNQQRVPFSMDGPMVMQQLRCNGVLEGIRICRRGYPNRVPFSAFLLRFRILHPPSSSASDPRSAVLQLCLALGINSQRYQLGRTKLFCRVGLISELEALRRERMNAILCKLQAWIRWGQAQRELCRRRDERVRVLTIQDAVRAHVRLRQWSWFRLWTRVRQLIPLVAERRRLVELEGENAELRMRGEQTQRELAKTRMALEEAEERREKAEERRMDERAKVDELRTELRRNEELLERMERKFDEQHAKIVRMNGMVGEHARALERMEEEKAAVEAEREMLREKYRTECIERESAEESLRVAQGENVRLRTEADEMEAEMGRMRAEMGRREEELGESRERGREQEEQMAELNRALAEANDRIGEMQPQLHTERSARRKAEGLVDELEAELGRMGEEVDRTNAKKEAMKEQIRTKEAQVRKLERKLEDKSAEMEECVAELKRTHKRGQNEMQEQVEEFRRKYLRLEAENAQMKCKLESQAQDAAIQLQKSRSRGARLDRMGDNQRESSVDSDGGGVGGGVLSRSLTSRPSASYHHSSSSVYPGSLSRRSRYQPHHPADPVSASDFFDLRRSASGASSSTTTNSSSALRRHGAISASANPMITSLTTTVDSGCSLLTRSPSSASTVSGSFQQQQSQYLTMTQKLEGAERRTQALERELREQKQEGQMAKRELEVYKHTLQEAERARESLSKQIRTLSSELESAGRAQKVQEERVHQMEMEGRKQKGEMGALKQKMEEEREEHRAEMARERKKHAEKAEEMAHEYDTRLRQLTKTQRNTEQLQGKLTEAESQLDKALGQLSQMERLQKTQNAIGETWESQYRTAQAELEGARDENAALKSRIRRQQRQIELLTQQSEMDSRMDELEERMGQLGTAPKGDEDEDEGEEVLIEMEVAVFNNNC